MLLPHPSTAAAGPAVASCLQGRSTVPRFRYFLLDRKTEVKKDSAAWQALLPTGRSSATGAARSGEQENVTRGEYFAVLRTFLEEAPHHRLVDAVSRRIRRPVSTDDLASVDIYLEKHGQFYHPSRVKTLAVGRELHFVVNAAFTESGKALIGTDFENIRRLTRQYAYRYVPHVHQLGEVRNLSSKKKWILFLGQWLEGYHEFHLQRSPSGDAVRMVLWDPIEGQVALTRKQISAVYHLAARILTAYYNLFTCEQVGSWHHAAGDFVVRTDPDIDLQLVTVRQYRPLISGPIDDIETVFQALLLFLLNLSVRMRIDRDSGTGDLLWSEEQAVAPTIGGFFDGLDLQARHGLIPERFPALFHSYLENLTGEELTDLLNAVVSRRFVSEIESTLVRRHLEGHSRAFQSATGRHNRVPTISIDKK